MLEIPMLQTLWSLWKKLGPTGCVAVVYGILEPGNGVPAVVGGYGPAELALLSGQSSEYAEYRHYRISI
jgi:hypothetical protein